MQVISTITDHKRKCPLYFKNKKKVLDWLHSLPLPNCSHQPSCRSRGQWGRWRPHPRQPRSRPSCPWASGRSRVGWSWTLRSTCKWHCPEHCILSSHVKLEEKGSGVKTVTTFIISWCLVHTHDQNAFSSRTPYSHLQGLCYPKQRKLAFFILATDASLKSSTFRTKVMLISHPSLYKRNQLYKLFLKVAL